MKQMKVWRRRLRRGMCLAALSGGMFFASCMVEVPSDVIQPEEMESLLYDYHLMQALAGELSPNEKYKRKQYEQYVFDKHGVSEAEMDSSLVWYMRHPKELEAIYKNLSQRMSDERAALEELVRPADRINRMTEAGDTVDIWDDYRLSRLSVHPLSDKLSFVIPADSNFHSFDTFEWKLDARYLGDTLRARAVMAMTLVLDKDTIGVSREIASSGECLLTLGCDSAYLPKEISGFIHYYPVKDTVTSDTLSLHPFRELLLSGITLTRYHCKDSLRMNGGRDSVVLDKKVEKPVEKKTPEVKEKTESTDTVKKEKELPLQKERRSVSKNRKKSGDTKNP